MWYNNYVKENLIKLYFYVTSGQSVVDRFRYLIMGIFALYVMLKLTNPLYLILMLIVSIPVLLGVGWYDVHKISKIRERLSIQFGTHYGIKQFELQEETVEILKEILKKL